MLFLDFRFPSSMGGAPTPLFWVGSLSVQGLLEKHKDYVQRANDYKRKTKALASLREKAAFRNPDEFYFAMTKGKTKGRATREGNFPCEYLEEIVGNERGSHSQTE